jgi:hypothetical protein
MRVTTLNQIFGMLAVAATLCGVALAQSAAAPPSMKTIGTPSAPANPEIVPSLFVLNSRGATLKGDTLTWTGVTPSSMIFSDRPVRSAGHQPTADVIAEWGSGDDSFARNPPNAFRGPMYAGAAGAAAYGAAAYYHPYAHPACGYYPYPPCY